MLAAQVTDQLSRHDLPRRHSFFRIGDRHGKQTAVVHQVDRAHQAVEAPQHLPHLLHRQLQLGIILHPEIKRFDPSGFPGQGQDHFRNNAKVPLAEQTIQVRSHTPLENGIDPGCAGRTQGTAVRVRPSGRTAVSSITAPKWSASGVIP